MNIDAIQNGVVLDAADQIEYDTGSLRRCATKAECAAQISELFELVKDRNNSYKDAIAEGKKPPEFEDYLIVINSLSDLMDMLDDTGKEKLSLILLKGQLSYCVKVIIGSRAKNISQYVYEKWYKTHISQADGIWVGSGVDGQYQIKLGKITSDMHEELSKQFGYSIRKGKGTRVKLINLEEEESTDDEF